jgi:hydrogenase maturation protein HypF
MHTVLIKINGRVQGVGFRPFIFQLAESHHIKGTVQNNMDGVKIIASGKRRDVSYFIQDITQKAPRLSIIEQIAVETIPEQKFYDFSIIASNRQGSSKLVIPVDSAICPDCLSELKDKKDFRYRYPFINCTQCGPRYTIIDELPYDRPYTSMKDFPMCRTCSEEYEDPRNRRHHAQPIACSDCGPAVLLVDQSGEPLPVMNPILETIQMLKQGKIVAIKGLGGYHLCCDAQNSEAVSTLRKRKNRPNRPLAVMASSIERVTAFANVTSEEEQLLLSPEAPIVVMTKHESYHLAAEVAPHLTTIGVMLPYTPLHHLLFLNNEELTLVMTSANPSGIPIIYRDTDAQKLLMDIADYVLIHNREILHPLDDSVVQVSNGLPDLFRRARGYVPDPIRVDNNLSGFIAFGGQQKSTFTIGRDGQVFMGPHLGDLDNIETISHYQNELKHLMKWTGAETKVAVIDAHPTYHTRYMKNEYSFDETIEVQHHHAHMAACMGENQLTKNCFGIILDGTGYGLDGAVWGFEVFYGNYEKVSRLAHLTYTPLPGNEKCIKEPWRNAVAMLIELFGDEGEKRAAKLFHSKQKEIHILRSMIQNQLNLVYGGTCGRLFDAVSAICGVCTISTYDGEAAIRLSEFASLKLDVGTYAYELKNENGTYQFDFSKMLLQIIDDIESGQSLPNISTKFHETIVSALADCVTKIQKQIEDVQKTVVLSGGSFHNQYIRSRLTSTLTEKGFRVYTHRKLPCSDAGLSYGQIMVAQAKRRS